MTIRVALEHRTTYTFAEPVEVFPHTVRLRPAPHSRTPIAAYSLTVTPRNHFINWQQDPFGNYLARLVFPEPVKELDICVDLVADMMVINPFDFFLEEYAERYPFAYPDALRADLEPYLRRVAESDADGPGPLVRQWVQQHITQRYARLTGDDRPRMVDFLVAVNTALQSDIAYTVRMEPGVQTPDTTLAKALGSCRDSAWLLVSVLREASLAARFPGGFLVNLGGDIATAGDLPAGGWRIGIEAASGSPLQVVTGAGQAFATSSTQKRTWATGVSDERRHHIVDPRTGRTAASPWAQVTCAAASALEANAASTAAIILGPEAPDWLRRNGIPARLDSLDGTVMTTPGWPEADR